MMFPFIRPILSRLIVLIGLFAIIIIIIIIVVTLLIFIAQISSLV